MIVGMEDISNEESAIQLRDQKGRLLPGHARIPGSGRPPGKKNWSVRALAEQMGVNPFQISLEILKTQCLPALPGERKKGRQVSTAEYIKVLTEIQSFLAPKLAATAVTGRDGGPIATAHLDVTQLMQDPELVAAAQALSLAATRQNAEALTERERPARVLPPVADEVIPDGETEEL